METLELFSKLVYENVVDDILIARCKRYVSIIIILYLSSHNHNVSFLLLKLFCSALEEIKRWSSNRGIVVARQSHKMQL